MFELMIMLSRLIFVFLIAYFIVLGILYIGEEREYEFFNFPRSSAIFHQRFVIIAIHVLAFVIMSYNYVSYTFDMAVISMGITFLAVFLYSVTVIKFIYKGSCPLIWDGVFFLLDIGVIMLTRLSPAVAQKQLIWIFIGINISLFIPLVFRLFKKLMKLEYIYLVFAWSFVLLPFIFGKTIYGATNWVQLFGITFQPSEVAKIFYIFYLACVFCKKMSYKQMIFPSAMAGGIVICLVLQRDLGGALIFFMTYMVIVYISTGNALLIGTGFALAAFAAKFAASHFDHIQRRVIAWSNPWSVVDDAGYQITQSLFAIGTRGMLGSGLTRGYPYKIPVVQTDFIFSAICEEFGMLFGLGLIGVLIMVLFRGVITSLRSNNMFFCMLSASITSILAFQSFLILGGVIKLIPMTGVTLPFVSYGGSSIIISIVMIGILAQISKQIASDSDYSDEGADEFEE